MQHDIIAEEPVYAIAAFDLAAVAPDVLWTGLVDWTFFLTRGNPVLAQLPQIPVSWGSLATLP